VLLLLWLRHYNYMWLLLLLLHYCSRLQRNQCRPHQLLLLLWRHLHWQLLQHKRC
jgi:hypothetical protein